MDSKKSKVVDYFLLGKRIRRFREEKHWTQQLLSEKCDLSTTNISHIERGATKPSLETLVKIANTLEVNINALLCDSLTSSVMPVFQEQIASLLHDCSNREIRILSDCIQSTKGIIRKYDK